MSNTRYNNLDSCNVSPVNPRRKHTTTPMRTRRKTSRREQGIDVHTVCSTPTAAQRSPRLQRSIRNSPRIHNVDSPSSSFPCSQDTQPDVVWDFTSPKLTNGRKKKEMKITVQELLENLNQCQTPECSSKSAPYVKLLENWMSKRPTEISVKKTENNKKELKKKSRRRIEELTKFIDSIEKLKETEVASNLRNLEEIHKVDTGGEATESNSSFKHSFLEAGSTDDSSEELWGEMDNSFIIKATQELDRVTLLIAHQNEEPLCTIPATLPKVPTTKIEPLSTIPATFPKVPTTKIKPLSTIPATFPKVPTAKIEPSVTVPDSHACVQHSDLLSQLSNVDWDFDADDEWDNGFLIEDDELSLIPEDVLSGTVTMKCDSPGTGSSKSNKMVKPEAPLSSKSNPTQFHKTTSVHTLPETGFSVPGQTVVQSAELFNSFEDDSFEDESLLCQPDILSRIDEVESLLSQPKCTPEEIKKKKDEAMKRRKSVQIKKKT